MVKSTKPNPKENHESSTSQSKDEKTQDAKANQHAIRYLIIGASLAIFNYTLYTILSNLIIKNNDLLWLSTLISTAVTTILAYILHSKITWKERPISKTAIYKFFIWNIMLTVAINPILTQLLSLITPLYESAYHIFEAMHIPFSYEFTLTTGAFVLTTIVTTIMNYLLYDRFVFGKPKNLNRQKNT